MWTSAHLSVRMVLDLAEWHATCLWLEDDGQQPVTLALDGSVRIHPLDRPDTILAACVADLTATAASRGTVTP